MTRHPDLFPVRFGSMPCTETKRSGVPEKIVSFFKNKMETAIRKC